MSPSTPFSTLDLIAGCTYGIIMLHLVFLAFHRSPERKIILWAAAVKLLASLVYSLYSFILLPDADTMSYHIIGVSSAQLASSNWNHYIALYPFFSLLQGEATSRMMGLSGLVHFFAFNSFLASSFIYAAMGLVGQILLYRTFVEEYPDPRLRRWWRWGILFLPSFTFWSSGLIKEPLGVLGLGCAVWGFQSLLTKIRLSGILCLLAGIYVLLLFRPQVVPILLAAALPWILQHRETTAAATGKTPLSLPSAGRTILIVSTLICLILLWQSQGRYIMEQLPTALMKDRAVYQTIEANTTDRGGVVANASWSSLLKAWPGATFYTLYRPILWEGLRSPLLLIAAVENFVLLLLTLRAFGMVVIRPAILKQALGSPLFLTSILFVALFTLGLGVSTPNLGTISRYRLPAMPFFIAVLAIIEYHYVQVGTKQTRPLTLSQRFGKVRRSSQLLIPPINRPKVEAHQGEAP